MSNGRRGVVRSPASTAPKRTHAVVSGAAAHLFWRLRNEPQMHKVVDSERWHKDSYL